MTAATCDRVGALLISESGVLAKHKAGSVFCPCLKRVIQLEALVRICCSGKGKINTREVRLD